MSGSDPNDCTHAVERGSTIMQVTDDRYECTFCGEQFKLVSTREAAPRAATEPQLDTADFNEGLRLHAQSPGHHYSLDDCRAAPGEPPLTRERLAAALHERYAAALCLDPEGPHTWPCAAFSQWMDDAASILEALATPTSAPEPES